MLAPGPTKPVDESAVQSAVLASRSALSTACVTSWPDDVAVGQRRRVRAARRRRASRRASVTRPLTTLHRSLAGAISESRSGLLLSWSAVWSSLGRVGRELCKQSQRSRGRFRKLWIVGQRRVVEADALQARQQRRWRGHGRARNDRALAGETPRRRHRAEARNRSPHAHRFL